MLSMTTIEKPTAPSPLDLVNTKATVNSRDFIYVPERNVDGTVRPELGRVASREEYRNDVDSDPRLEQTAESFEATKVTLDREATDDKLEDNLDGFTIHNDTEDHLSQDHDTLPEDLKSELGEPDDDEVKA